MISTEKMNSMIDYLKSEQGKLDMKNYWDGLENAEKIYNAFVDRFYNKHKDNMPVVIDKIITKYKSNKYNNKELGLGYEPRTDLYWVLLRIAETHGKRVKLNSRKYEDYVNEFTTLAYTFDGYFIQRMDGQGVVVKIEKI